MASEYAPTWAELDTTATWLDVDYSDVPKFAAKWHSDLTHLVEDLEISLQQRKGTTMNKQQIQRVRMLRYLQKRRAVKRATDTYAQVIYLCAVHKLESQQSVKHYEPYQRLTSTSPPQPDKHLFALGSITNLDPPKTPTALSGITTAGTPVGAL